MRRSVTQARKPQAQEVCLLCVVYSVSLGCVQPKQKELNSHSWMLHKHSIEFVSGGLSDAQQQTMTAPPCGSTAALPICGFTATVLGNKMY